MITLLQKYGLKKLTSDIYSIHPDQDEMNASMIAYYYSDTFKFCIEILLEDLWNSFQYSLWSPSKLSSEIPNTIYKYSAPSEYFLENIKNNALFFNSREKFNDPFDSINQLHYSFNRNTFFNNFFKHADYYTSEWIQYDGENTVRNLFNKLFDNGWEKRILNFIKHYIEKRMSKIGITCLTSKWNNKVMWSRYTNGYRGICIRYEIDQVTDIDRFIYANVEYKEQFFPMNVITRPKESLKYCLFSKTLDWSEEEETRIISRTTGLKKGFIPQEVIIGTRTSKNLIQKISKILPNAKYSKIFLNSNNQLSKIKFDI